MYIYLGQRTQFRYPSYRHQEACWSVTTGQTDKPDCAMVVGGGWGMAEGRKSKKLGLAKDACSINSSFL